MEPNSELAKKKADLKLKIIRDFSFLLDCRPVVVDERITKYVLKEGEEDEEIISDLPLVFDIVYSCKTYDYEGKQLVKYPVGRIGNSDKKDSLIRKLLLTMKVNETAWFNVSEDQVYRKKDPDEKQILEMVELIDEDEEFQELEDTNSSERKGCHYEITVEKLEYKNADTIDSKRLVFDQKKIEAREYFIKGDYMEALKVYRFIYDITSNCSLKLFSKEDLLEIEGMNDNSKVNGLKCYFKLIEKKENIEQQIHEHAEHSIKCLTMRPSNDCVIHFLSAKWKLKERNLQGAYQEAKKSYELKPTKEAERLVELIREEFQHKNMVRVKVNE